MISLDQDDDLADKRTVLVDSHSELPPSSMHPMEQQRPVSLSQTPVIGQSSAHLQPYGASNPGSLPGSDQTAPHSSSHAGPVPKHGLRNLFVVLFVLALLAPVVALIVRWASNRNKDIEIPTTVVDLSKATPTPPPPVEKAKVRLKVTANKPITLRRDGTSLGNKTLFEEEIEKSDSKIRFTVTNSNCKPSEFDFVPSESKEISVKCGKRK